MLLNFPSFAINFCFEQDMLIKKQLPDKRINVGTEFHFVCFLLFLRLNHLVSNLLHDSTCISRSPSLYPSLCLCLMYLIV